MLVLSRKMGEAVSIDGPVRVMVVSIQGGTVRLGFEADRGVRIDRDEVRERRLASPTAQPVTHP